MHESASCLFSFAAGEAQEPNAERDGQGRRRRIFPLQAVVYRKKWLTLR